MIFLTEYNYIKNYLSTKIEKNFSLYLLKSSLWKNVYLIQTSEKKYILKSSPKTNTANSITKEVEAFKYLGQNDILNFPQIIWAEAIDNMDFLCVEYLTNEKKFDTIHLAKILQKVHSLTLPNNNQDNYSFAFSLLKDLAISLFNIRYNIIDRKLTKDLLTIWKKIKNLIDIKRDSFKKGEHLSFINGDLYHDIFTQNNKIYLIDWHVSGFGDKAWDVARFIYAYPKETKEFLNEYKKNLTNYKDFIARLEIYKIVNQLLILTGHIYSSNKILDFIEDNNNLIKKTIIKKTETLIKNINLSL